MTGIDDTDGIADVSFDNFNYRTEVTDINFN